MDTIKKNREAINNYSSLLNICKPYISKDNLPLLRTGYEIVLEAYKDKTMKYGEQYYYHALEVANIVADEIGLGIPSVVTAMMHDIYSVNDLLVNKLEESGLKQVKAILDGLQKISAVKIKNSGIQSENYIKLLLSLSDDIRVILIRLADRLAHMRSIELFDEDKQIQLAMESSGLYAPLAHRLGLYRIKTELEEISMKIVEPEIYHDIARKLKETRTIRNNYINGIIEPLNTELEKHSINCEIKGRPKSISSIWNKIKKQSVEFEEVYDLFAIRIILKMESNNEKADCWKAYSIVTDLFRPNPNRLRDWISSPKANGYESLHTTVVGPDGKWVEIQIRTERMDEIAEKGYAAHWKYKSSSARTTTDKWLVKLKESIDNPDTGSAKESGSSKLELYSDEIFIFTPMGDLKKLPYGSSVLDFAFSIHGDVGSKCTGAKVNGKIVPFKHKLKNGDMVEIRISKNQLPKPDWLNYVITNKAKSRIKRLLKDREFDLAKDGKELLLRKFSQWKIDISADPIHKLVNLLKLKNSLELYQMVGEEKIDLPEIKRLLTSETIQQEHVFDSIIPESAEDIIKRTVSKTSDFLVIDNNIDRVDYQLAGCCNPIFGDKVFGFVTIGRGTKIHRLNCPNAKEMVSRYPYRIVKVKWTGVSDSSGYLASVKITGIDDFGILNNITKVVGDEMDMKVRSINVDTKDGLFEGNLTVMVKDKGHLDLLIKKIYKIKGVLNAMRLDEY